MRADRTVSYHKAFARFLFRYAVFKEQGTAPGARLSQGCTDATLARERLAAAEFARMKSARATRPRAYSLKAKQRL
jgi:hypothetical protein